MHFILATIMLLSHGGSPMAGHEENAIIIAGVCITCLVVAGYKKIVQGIRWLRARLGL